VCVCTSLGQSQPFALKPGIQTRLDALIPANSGSRAGVDWVRRYARSKCSDTTVRTVLTGPRTRPMARIWASLVSLRSFKGPSPRRRLAAGVGVRGAQCAMPSMHALCVSSLWGSTRPWPRAIVIISHTMSSLRAASWEVGVRRTRKQQRHGGSWGVVVRMDKGGESYLCASGHP
jgi:hypothetical protein